MKKNLVSRSKSSFKIEHKKVKKTVVRPRTRRVKRIRMVKKMISKPVLKYVDKIVHKNKMVPGY